VAGSGVDALWGSGGSGTRSVMEYGGPRIAVYEGECGKALDWGVIRGIGVFGPGRCCDEDCIIMRELENTYIDSCHSEGGLV